MKTKDQLYQEALAYHEKPKPGKLELHSSKPCQTEKDLSLAYSPGVAAPCEEIHKKPMEVYRYTNRGNLVAVISNGSAVLGLGNIGPSAAKPVMEGKAVLFKQFADIDVFDLELKAETPDRFIESVISLEPTFGGINLEDIKAPECFVIEEQLKQKLKIPVFHDDQHGTAIISTAALINACQLQKKKLKNIKVVFSGAGAAALACADLFVKVGVSKENIFICDSKGLVFQGRKESMNSYKEKFAVKSSLRTLEQVLKGADCFVGLSVGNILTRETLKSMGSRPIVFAMANPTPEILPEAAYQACKDVIMATGRSDYPNQVNNVLGFPAIFRGALDTQATCINIEMKLAAVHALAKLAQEDVPESVSLAYGGKSFYFGSHYIIPKPFDPRVLLRVAPEVAKAAMKSGAARKNIEDFEAYMEKLESIQGPSKVFIRSIIHKVKHHGKKSPLPKIVFPEGNNKKILLAVNSLREENICEPIVLGYQEGIEEKIHALNLHHLKNLQIIHPRKSKQFPTYAEMLYKKRQRKGVMHSEAENLVANPNYFAALMVENGDAEGCISGAGQNYADAVKPILHIIGPAKEHKEVFGMNIVLMEKKIFLLADTTLHKDPSAEILADIASLLVEASSDFNLDPQVAMLSYSSFTAKGPTPQKMRQAVELFKEKHPQVSVDGDIQADTAVNHDILKSIFPFSTLKDSANILIFPNLESSNIGYKLLQQLGKGKLEVLGPFLMGANKPANVVQRTTSVEGIVQSTALIALQIRRNRNLLHTSTS